ncbi:hypothetical protein D3C80_561050 [compost metagenome]
MKNIFIILLTFLYVNSYSQVKDSFKTSNYPSNPQWNGDITEWFVNANEQLQTKKSTTNKQVYISTANSLSVNTRWSFYVQMDFDPSTSNQLRVYLVSDQPDLNQALNGYFIQIGKSGSSDSFDLYKQVGTKLTKLFDGIPRPRTKASQFKASIEVSRSITGLWEIKSKIDNETQFVTDGSITDNTYQTTSFFGILAKYTASRSNQFYFDELTIERHEAIKPLPPVYAGKPGDVIFTELFPNPSHQIDLPTSEFVELYNTSDSVINLKGWKYADVTTIYTFNEGVINPKEYLILCSKNDTSNYLHYGKTLGLSPWPSLNNSGDLLTLKNAEGAVINQVNYSDAWYRDTHKKSGGYSLELMEDMLLCNPAQRWTASVAAEGGTPGKRNSVSDLTLTNLAITSLNVIDSLTLTVNFSTGIDSSSVLTENIQLQPLAKIKNIQLINPFNEQLIIHLEKPLTEGSQYGILINELKDCFGNKRSFSSNFLLPNKIKPGDILINEILFNPKPNGVDFVEIINNSMKVIDLKELMIGGRNSKDSLLFYPITLNTTLMHPGDITVICANPNVVKEQYYCKNPEAIIKVKTIPAYNNNAGTVLLKSRTEIIDRFDYSEKMHFALINDPKGVSLERVSLSRATNAPGNFHSASSTVGYATPGYQNSQAQHDDTINDEISLSSSIISPDNDGQDDILSINYHFRENGLVVNIFVYDRNGQMIKRLANNLLLGTEGSIVWDGLTDSLQPAFIGPHLLLIEIFNATGTIRRYKKSVVVAQKFN